MSGRIRHRKILRDSIQGITKPALMRLAHRAGIKRVSKLVFPELRMIIKLNLEKVIKDAFLITEHNRKKTLGDEEVKKALQYRGVNILYYEKKSKIVNKDDKDKDKKSSDTLNINKKKSHSDITLNIYIQRVLTQISPSSGLNAASLSQLNQFLMVLLDKITDISKQLLYNDEKKTLTLREIQSAVRLILTGDLAKNAIREGTKAVTKFNESVSHTDDTKGLSIPKAFRSGLTFAPSRIENLMRGIHKLNTNYKEDIRIGNSASVYLAAVLEYITSEILSLSKNVTRDYNKVRITSRSIYLAIYNDEELKALFDNLGIVLAKGGVLPKIHINLLKKKN